jgi:hypothetical protein
VRSHVALAGPRTEALDLRDHVVKRTQGQGLTGQWPTDGGRIATQGGG